MRARSSCLLGLSVTAVTASLIACGSFSGSDAPGGTTDGGAADAATGMANESGASDSRAPPAGACLPDAGTAFLAADFEESPARYYVMGAPSGLSAATAPDAWTVDNTTSTCGAHSLEVSYANNGYSIEALQDVGMTVKTVTATLDINFEDLSKTVHDETIITIGVRNPAFDHCYVALQVFNAGTKDLGIQSHCGKVDSNQFKGQLIGNPEALGWLHIVFTLELAKQNASLSVNGAAAQNLPLMSDVAAGGTTVYSEIGITSPSVAPGASRVRFDNVRVDIQ